MRIIPAIDILNGKCVRLSKGDYNHQTVYNEDPVEVALVMEAHGIQFLHVVDLDGARSRHIVNHKVLQAIATRTNLKIDFGGGIKSDGDAAIAFDCGAEQITAGSIAVTDPEILLGWLDHYGADKIILGADCQDRMIATHGWSEHSALDVSIFIADYSGKGIEHVICTDIAKDGMLEGPSQQLYKDILSLVKINLIASGGITSLLDLQQLKETGCSGAIIGKAIYENRISLKELSTLC
jgi:phosphoribosylformimino-5-aminoimidazole carboxamide ribotide isomerase